ncbi:pilus assembly protein TadG-related protein [Pararhizobium arenae]|uniref:pilus assembly protein TadG-related protein n=1 Tax=Pararhizobium arenae TaxID=1856850 RepID=UPI000A456B56|nr:pilus assembly protein TadG-related protein [Pararhizobium arenae]
MNTGLLCQLLSKLPSLVRSRDGNFALMGALTLPLLLALGGGVVNVNSYFADRSALQSVADAAALAAAKEASLNGWSKTSALSVAQGYLMAHRDAREPLPLLEVEVDPTLKQVKVTVVQDHKSYFVAGFFADTPNIVVSSTARTNSSSNICVIGLEKTGTATISLETNAVISADRCAVYSNSSSVSGLTSTGNASLSAQLTCTTGGYVGASKNFKNGLPLTDCPVVIDPLADRPMPEVTSCTKQNADYQHYRGTLQPGTYCGGLIIRSSSQVSLQPGVYIIKDGPLVVEANSAVNAKGVGFFFTGEDARLLFASGSSVDIEAPVKGPLAGIAMFQDRESAEQDFVITSNDARKLIGTIYLPNGNLIIDANNKVADESAYTAIVVKRLRLSKGPNLVLNTDYEQTLVPVPEGVGPQASNVRLLR